jgi:DNA-binding CsgD family transcriptional regulator
MNPAATDFVTRSSELRSRSPLWVQSRQPVVTNRWGSTMTRVRDVAFIRKLCGLGLPAQRLAQSLLPALRGLIPSHSAGVFWVDAEGEMTGLFAERLLPPEAMAAYYERHYPTRGEGFVDAVRRRAQQKDPVSFHSFTPTERDTDYFRDVMHQLDAYHVLYGILHADGRARAQISFYRGAADRPFDSASADTLRALLRYIGAGLARQAVAVRASEPAVTVEEELGIVTLQGTIVSASEDWRKLLRLAAVAEVSPQTAGQEQPLIERFLARLCAPQGGTADRVPGPREVMHETAWGRFVIRAFALTDAKGRRAPQVGILICRDEPRSVLLVHGTGRSVLSPQQREVALLLAQGLSNREIAERLGLSFNTASSHVKQVYARLEVGDRHAVAERLLHLAQAAAAR